MFLFHKKRATPVKSSTDSAEETALWNKIFRSFLENPRDVITVPMDSRPGKWFHVSVEEGKILISTGNTIPYCMITTKRYLQKEELLPLLSCYRRRDTMDYEAKEAQKLSRSSSYWYGIFADLDIK